MEKQDLIQRSYHLCQRHFDLFDQVNNTNHNQALRTILDSIITGKEQTQKKQLLDNSLMFIAFGFFMILLSFITDNPYIYLTGLSLGIFLVLYGGIGGLRHALSRTNHY